MSSVNNLAEQSQNSTCFRQNWREKGVTFPAEGTNFVLVNQRGRRVLSCKPAIPGRLAAPLGRPLFNNRTHRSGLKTSCSVELSCISSKTLFRAICVTSEVIDVATKKIQCPILLVVVSICSCFS